MPWQKSRPDFFRANFLLQFIKRLSVERLHHVYQDAHNRDFKLTAWISRDTTLSMEDYSLSLFSSVPPDASLETVLGKVCRLEREKKFRADLTEQMKRQLEERRYERLMFEESLTAREAYPYTVRCAWRIVLLLTWVRGLVSVGRTLKQAIGLPGLYSPDPWMSEEWYSLPQEMAPFKQLRAERCSLLPSTENVVRWGMLAEEAIRALNIRRGTYHNPREGVWGTSFLLENPIENFPHPTHILEWEELLIQDTVRLARHSRDRARRYLEETYSLYDHETEFLISAALERVTKNHRAPKEVKAALMEYRLESIIEQDDIDPRTKITALRALAQVQGLNSVSQEEDLFGDLIAESERNDTSRSLEGGDHQSPQLSGE